MADVQNYVLEEREVVRKEYNLDLPKFFADAFGLKLQALEVDGNQIQIMATMPADELTHRLLGQMAQMRIEGDEFFFVLDEQERAVDVIRHGDADLCSSFVTAEEFYRQFGNPDKWDRLGRLVRDGGLLGLYKGIREDGSTGWMTRQNYHALGLSDASINYGVRKGTWEKRLISEEDFDELPITPKARRAVKYVYRAIPGYFEV